MTRKPPPEYLLAPFTIIVDTREQAPWHFRGFRTTTLVSGEKHRVPLIVPVESRGLTTGDYSLVGCEENGICIERKSHEDAVSTFSHGRDRFERELERMQAFRYAAVVIEADWPTIMHKPPKHSRFTPKSFVESVVAWSQRYPKTHWFPMSGKADAEKMTFRLLRRFAKDEAERKKAESGEK